MKNVLIISNPNSGQKQGTEMADSLRSILQEKGITTMNYETKGDDDFHHLIETYMSKGFDTIAILGGDGTVSRIVNDVAELDNRPKILLMPLGTTNNLARSLQTELDLEQLLVKIENDNLVEQQIDIGKINDQYFISTVSVGSIPEIAWKADDDVKEKFGPFGYVLEGMQVLNEQKSFDVTIKTDVEEFILDEAFIIVVGLSNSVFGIPTFFKNAQIDDGKLDMYILKHSDLLSEVGTLARHVLPNETDNNEKEDELSHTTSFTQATLDSASDMNFAVDGEKGPKFPVELKILNKHLTFIVPKE